MAAYGKEGILCWDGIENKTVLRLPNAAPEIFVSQQSRDEMFLKQAESFLFQLEGLATVEEGIQALSVCDAARLSNKNAREELVNNGNH